MRPARRPGVLVALLAALVLSAGGAARAQAPPAPPPLPVVFVHGLNASDRTWSEVTAALDGLGWGAPVPLHAVLNADPASTHHADDVVLAPLPPEAAAAHVFTVNFDAALAADGTVQPYDAPRVAGQSASNQAAVAKQGYALGRMVEAVRAATGAERVVLVGHSLGGLAIREYLQRRDAAGRPRWWAAPDAPGGHGVARVVTTGAPHLGSDAGAGFAVVVPGLDLASEAVRDVRTTYRAQGPGRFLFGGPEDLTGFHNTDVNADGDVDDHVDGLNEGTADHPRHPLPPDVEYAWITARDCGFLCFGDGDGVVPWAHQWLYADVGGVRRAAPLGRAEHYLTAVHHLDQPQDVEAILRALDEPDDAALRWPLPAGGAGWTGALAQRGPETDAAPGTDHDVFAVAVPEPGTLTLALDAGPAEAWALTVADGAAARVVAGGAGPAWTSTNVTAEAVVTASMAVAARDPVYPYALRAAFTPLRRLRCPGAGAGPRMTLRLDADVAANGGLAAGDEVGVFDAAGRCVGAATWAPAVGAPAPPALHLELRGDDPATPAVEGAADGAALLLRVAGADDDAAHPDVRVADASGAVGSLRFAAGAAVRAVALGAAAPVAVERAAGVALGLRLYPNPARERLRVAFDLPAPGPVRAEVFDAWGRRRAVLADAPFAAGHHELDWRLAGVPAGVYFVRLSAGAASAARPVVVGGR